MTGLQVKDFVEQVYLQLHLLETAGKLTAAEVVALGPQIVLARLNKEALEI